MSVLSTQAPASLGQLHITDSISAEAWIFLAVTLLVSGLTALLQPAERQRVFRTGVFFAVFTLLLLASGWLDAVGMRKINQVLREASTICIGLALIRLWGIALFGLLLPRLRINAPEIMEDVVVFVGYIAWGLVRLRYAGLDLSQIVTTSAVITAVIAFSMQDTLGNVLSGLALQMGDALALGDWVRVGNTSGQVVGVRWRSTAIETRNGEIVVIPNSVLMKNEFTLVGKRGSTMVPQRRWIWFFINLETSPGIVIETVEKAIRSADIPGVANRPASCVLMDFEQGNAKYALRYWLSDIRNDDGTDSAMRQHLFAALQRASIRIAMPEYNVYLTKENERYQESLRLRDLQHRLEALAHVDLFSKLDDSERRTIAERLRYAPFASGDVITRQGAVAHWLYILTRGDVDIWDEQGGRRELLGTLSAGSFFGEMGLLTGAPRSATVQAKSDVECYLLDKDSFHSVLHARPELAELIASMLTQRQGRHPVASKADQRQHTSAHQPELLLRIKQFFGLAGNG